MCVSPSSSSGARRWVAVRRGWFDVSFIHHHHPVRNFGWLRGVWAGWCLIHPHPHHQVRNFGRLRGELSLDGFSLFGSSGKLARKLAQPVAVRRVALYATAFTDEQVCPPRPGRARSAPLPSHSHNARSKGRRLVAIERETHGHATDLPLVSFETPLCFASASLYNSRGHSLPPSNDARGGGAVASSRCARGCTTRGSTRTSENAPASRTWRLFASD